MGARLFLQPEGGLQRLDGLRVGQKVTVYRLKMCYKDDWRPNIPDKGVLVAIDPKRRWARVRFDVQGGSYTECFFPGEIMKAERR